jgi:HSP20 family protein
MTYRQFHNPLGLVNQWRRDFERAFGPTDECEHYSGVTQAAWSPAVDIKEREDAYVLSADMPGVDPKDIEVNMEKGILTIKGKRSTEAAQDRKRYTRVERVNGDFYRRFSLPETADAEKISAKSSNGVLEVRIPKQEKVKPRRITVQ